jgi:hypothetical protein
MCSEEANAFVQCVQQAQPSRLQGDRTHENVEEYGEAENDESNEQVGTLEAREESGTVGETSEVVAGTENVRKQSQNVSADQTGTEESSERAEGSEELTEFINGHEHLSGTITVYVTGEAYQLGIC